MAGTVQHIEEIVDTVERSESESTLRETTLTTFTESEQTIQRTFGNPYLDRSLELRFIPVYQRFEVTSVPILARPGLATILREPDPSPRAGANLGARLGALRGAATAAPLVADLAPRVRATLTATVRAGNEDALRTPMLSLLQRAVSPDEARRSVRLDHGLAWDKADTLANAVHVPLADADTARKAWGLRGRVAERLADALERVRPDVLGRLFRQPRVRVVHVFAGIHVEAVAGTCVLPDIPDHLRVVVPGGTHYAPVAETAV